MYEFSGSLSKAVKKARLERGLSQEALAEKLGIDKRTILNIENKKANPKMELLYPLLRLLRIKPSEVFYPEIEMADEEVDEMEARLLSFDSRERHILISAINRAIDGYIEARNEIDN